MLESDYHAKFTLFDKVYCLDYKMKIAQALAYRGEPESYEHQENAWWLAHLLNCSTLELKLMMNDDLSEQQLHHYLTGLQRLEQGEPLAYIIGNQPFWTLDLDVTTDTLVPRPDTEILIETVLNLPLPTKTNMVDLGTGTGAIALSLASERPHWQVLATDINDKTLAVAKRNAQKHGLNHVQFALGAWYEAVPHQEKFDLIVSNPPYIDEHDKHLNQLHYEPRRALVAPQKGLADLMMIIQQSVNYLNPQAWIVLEHGYNQGQDVRTLLQNVGFSHVQTLQDYGANDRISLGQWLNTEA